MENARSRRCWLIVLVLVLSLRGGTEASARWQSTASASHTVSSATLAPPTSPAAAPGTCVPRSSDSIDVSWTPTASRWADGYLVSRATQSGGPYQVVGTVVGQGVSSYSDSGLAFSTMYHYVVEATKYNWRSVQTAEVKRQTRNTNCV
jgi:hypothetical protein